MTQRAELPMLEKPDTQLKNMEQVLCTNVMAEELVKRISGFSAPPVFLVRTKAGEIEISLVDLGFSNREFLDMIIARSLEQSARKIEALKTCLSGSFAVTIPSVDRVIEDARQRFCEKAGL